MYSELNYRVLHMGDHLVSFRFTDCRFERDIEPGLGRNGEMELGCTFLCTKRMNKAFNWSLLEDRAYIHQLMAFYVSPFSTYMFNTSQLSYSN